jgi:hypothetical protein
MSKRRTPADLAREAAELQARAARLAGLNEARALLETLKRDLRAGESAANDAETPAAAEAAFADALANAEALRAVVAKLAGVVEAPKPEPEPLEIERC